MTVAQIEAALRGLVGKWFPELMFKTHLMHKGRVTRVYGLGGSVGFDNGTACYAVDIQPLNNDGTVNNAQVPLTEVPLDIPGAGNGRGFFALPALNSTVRYGFYNGNPSSPYIAAVTGDGLTIEAVTDDTISIRRSAGEGLDLNANSAVLEGPQIKLGAGASRGVARLDDTVTVTIPAGAVVVSVPNPGGLPPTLQIPNPAPITLTGAVTSASTKTKTE